MSRLFWCGAWITAVALWGCAEGPGEVPAQAAESAVHPTSDVAPEPIPSLQVIPGTYLARRDSEDWVEEIDRAEAGPQFLIYVEPQLRSPAEGPWALTLARDGDARFIRIPNLHVDRATGRLTFLLQSDAMLPGDYLVLLTLEEGGRATGPEQQGFRFRIR